ncbi:MAG: indolepyruvate ferredoxin oxidoreductase subunit alpha [Rhodospirillaceae bacterium]|nr:indolepyruvate ferredoxin oxidoreductase subunit alpha [Rhodospirillaceae bacterium]
MSAERSFAKEVEQLRLGDGETFRGEGILAVTKALLQSGVSYVGGYQGAPVSHLIDVLVDAEDMMAEMGVHVETCTNEASAAAMLGASVNYPIRGAVTWKSIVGTNVASDGLSNLASPGVIGGALIVVGEDYGEGASVIQERTHAVAMKSSMWLLDPRPDLPAIVDMVEHGFALSEASNTPVFLELRIRACHVQGEFLAKDNVKPAVNARDGLTDPAKFDYAHLPHPPVTYTQEIAKVTERLPKAQDYIVKHGLNEVFEGERADIGIIVQGGLYNVLMRRLAVMGQADAFGNSKVPMLVLNVTHPLVPDQIIEFCKDKKSVLMLEEGNPEFIEHQINSALRKSGVDTQLYGKDVMPPAGEYSAEALQQGLTTFFEAVGIDHPSATPKADLRQAGLDALGAPLPPRPPGFCTGCPERPVYAAIKVLEEEVGKVHISADIGCHSFATFEPFSLGNSILGFGMSLASAAAVAPFQKKRSISIMGDGGFWHNGLTSGVISSLLNQGDSILIIMQNGYTSATGQQFIPSSAKARGDHVPGMTIGETLSALGVSWLRTVYTYGVSNMVDTLRDALTTPHQGLKVIIADGECQLAKQRRVRQERAVSLKKGERVVLPRFDVDADICTGDHACIRLSGCPSLTIAPNPDPLKADPIASITDTCVGCGLCGAVVHADGLCPSFYMTETVMNAGGGERFMSTLRQGVIAMMAGAAHD